MRRLRLGLAAIVVLLLMTGPINDAKECSGNEICPGTCSGSVCTAGGPPNQVCRDHPQPCLQWVCTGFCG